MSVYLGKDRKRGTVTKTATHITVAGLTTRTENSEHKLYMDNYFSPDISKRNALLLERSSN
jgi:hypothetical protein